MGVSTWLTLPPPFLPPENRARFPAGRGGPCLKAASRAHLAAAAPPQCRCPGRPRPSGGVPPAARPVTGGPAQRPAGGLPCRRMREDLSEGGETRDRRRTLCCGPSRDPKKPHGSSLVQISLSLTQIHQVHTFLGSAQPGRTSWAWSLNTPSAASELPSARSRRSPSAPALHGGLGEGASVGDGGLLHTRLPGAPSAWPPPPPPWQLPPQPGVRDHPACLPAGP